MKLVLLTAVTLLLAAPFAFAEDDLASLFAHMEQRCQEDFKLICATPVEDPTFDELVAKTPLVDTVEELLEINGIENNRTITGETIAPHVLMAVARMN